MVWLNDKKSVKTERQVVQGEFHSMALSVYLMNNISFSNLEGTPLTVDGKIQEVLKNYEDVFGIPVELPPQRTHDHKIPLVEGALPVNISSLTDTHLLKRMQLKLWSRNYWKHELKLDKQTVKDKFPIPIIEELIDELHGAKLFTKLDLRLCYHQIRMNEADVAKTAFRTHEGHYELLVMPFRLTNVPSTFQSLMNELLKRGAYEWNSAAQTTFKALKQAMISALVLKLPDFSKEFIVETDASGGGIGAFLVVVVALEKWRGYLLDRHFKIKTNHISLKYLLDQIMSTPTQLKWLPNLMGFDFAIVYKKGVDNVTTDALSRMQNPAELLSIIGTTSVTTDLYNRIVDSWDQDHTLKTLISKLQSSLNE
ncbi:reverse transcriptase [Tanacetum coccineum]